MWFSFALAGSVQVLGDPTFRAPDGIVDAAVAPDGAAWVLSEHGAIVGFSTEGAILAELDACSATTVHTDLWLSESGAHAGVVCDDRFRVLALPRGEVVLEVPFQTRSAWLTDAELFLVGEPFEDGETTSTQVVAYALSDGSLQRSVEGDYAAVASVGGKVLALQRDLPEAPSDAVVPTDEPPPTPQPGWRLVRLTSQVEPTTIVFSGTEAPHLGQRDASTLCLTRGRRGLCYDTGTDAPVTWRREDRPFLAPDQGVPICAASRCYDVDPTRLRPTGTAPGIGRIEDLVASRDGEHLLTRDHRNQVLHHGPRGRFPLAETDGAIAISPSGRYAWYQTARRSIRVRLIDGVRTTLPRATAAVFDEDDGLWLAIPHQGETTLLSRLPTGLDSPLPLIPLHDRRTITDLQLGGARMLLEYAEDDLYAVVDLDQRAPIDAKGKPTRKPHVEHLFTEQTPLLLTDAGTVLRTVATDDGYQVLGTLQSLPDGGLTSDTVLHTSTQPVHLGGHRSGVALDDDAIDSFMGTHRRSGQLPGPAYRVWVYDERVYIALRDGRLAILD